MPDKLFIFVEGDDDEMFFDKMVKNYLACSIKQYARKPKHKIADYLFNLKRMNADYLLVGDINMKPCITAKKQDLSRIYKLEMDKILIVRKEIESWYLAGLDEAHCKQFGIPVVRDTQKVDKERFEHEFIPKKFKDNKKDFLNEILRVYSIETAKQKNASFKYFADKYHL
jgi:hypothetical protein